MSATLNAEMFSEYFSKLPFRPFYGNLVMVLQRALVLFSFLMKLRTIDHSIPLSISHNVIRLSIPGKVTSIAGFLSCR